MRNLLPLALVTGLFTSFSLTAHDDWNAVEYSLEEANKPSPMPDRIVLTWAVMGPRSGAKNPSPQTTR